MAPALAFLTCLALTTGVDGQSTPIKVMGAVRDAVTDAPIGNARIFVIERAEEIRSASNGFFVLDDVTPGQLRLIVSAPGYLEQRADRDVGQGDVVLILLTPEPIDVPGVSASGVRRGLARRRVALNTPFRHFEAEMLEVTLAPNLHEFVRERSNLQLRRFGRDICYHLPGDLPGNYYRLPVYLDDVRVSHGVFWALRPADVGLFEIFSRVPMVRAYTKRFLDDVGTGRLSVMPLEAQQPKHLC